jgi:hypothetical protein
MWGGAGAGNIVHEAPHSTRDDAVEAQQDGLDVSSHRIILPDNN